MLPPLMTPRELFAFAARLGTNLTENQIPGHVEKIIDRLKLKSCADTFIGSHAGFSGSQRKRTSIGYQLISEPGLIVLDEPTSGLDSVNALKIVEDLKKEAVSNQKAVICTIH